MAGTAVGDGEGDVVGDSETAGADDVADDVAVAVETGEAIAEVVADGGTLESHAAIPSDDVPRSRLARSADAGARRATA
jgi:hypothetical protein